MERKRLGILGGLGPAASVYLTDQIVQLTDASSDQEHLDFVLLNRPQIPDRTAFLLGKSDKDFTPAVCEALRTLVKLDCEVVCVPCVTSHAAYAAMLTAANPAQVIDFPQEIAQDVKNRGCVNIGILATSGTVKTGFLQRVMENSGLCAVIPDPQIQSCVDSVIYDDIKAGKTADPQKVQEIICAMKAQGCDSLVLGCTELPLMRLELDADGKYAGMYISDSLKVLAKAALRECGLPIKAGK